jgi:hypothetical protein
MPANLPPEYFKAEEKYLRAKTVEEKILATQELIRVAPKHKGAEKLQKMLKRRLAKLRQELRKQQSRRVGGGPSFAIRKEGAAQVAFVGMPNSGKSALLRSLTSARPEVSSYPFTTREPVPGMMRFEDIQIQLVEVPALIKGSSLGRGLGAKPLSVARNADAIALVLDASADPLEQAEILIEELEATGIKLNRRPPKLSIQRRATGGIEIRGASLFEGGEAKLKRTLQDRRIHNAIVIIDEPITAEDLEDALDGSSVYRQAIIIVTKGDAEGARERFEELKRSLGNRFPMTLVSPGKGEGQTGLKELIFKNLGLIRIYTKRPDERPSERPVVLPRGSTILDVAKAVHKDLAQNLKFARVWGSARFPGQQVSRDHLLKDKDVVELHA